MTTTPKRLRVLLLVDQLSGLGGGAEVFLVGLATHLPSDRFEVFVCATRAVAPGPLAEILEAGAVPYIALGRRSRWDLLRMRRLAALLGSGRFDIVHAHKFGSNVWGTLFGRACRVPVVIAHEHTWSYKGRPLRKWIDGRIVGRLATRFIAVSDADAARMVEDEKVASEKVVVMPTGYVARPLAPDTDLRSELGLTSETPLIGTAVVFRPQKAVEVLLEAHARLLRTMPDVHLVIAGEGPTRAEIQRRARELSLDGRVHFLGHRDDVDAILRSLDVAALSSDFEGSPLFVLECMANGTPIVATAVGGIPQMVLDGETGVLVPPRDPEALAGAIEHLLVDPERRAVLAAAAANRLSEFRIDAVARRFADLYETLAAEAGLRKMNDPAERR
jgi:glycosyltransferase involved in cell wall biosynthesis